MVNVLRSCWEDFQQLYLLYHLLEGGALVFQKDHILPQYISDICEYLRYQMVNPWYGLHRIDKVKIY